MTEREGLAPEKVEEIAINALENAGVQTTGNEEVNRLVSEFVEEYANKPGEDVREAAENLAEKWKSKGVTELEPVTITGKPAEQGLWEQAIARGEAGEKPTPFNELTPEQQKMVKDAKAEARKAAGEELARLGVSPKGAPEADLSTARKAIAEKEAENNREYATWLKKHPEVEPGWEALCAFRAEERGGRAGTKQPAEPETEIAEREPTAAEEQDPKELVRDTLKSHGIDLDDSREKYAKLERESAGTTSNKKQAELNQKAAEMTGKSLEKIATVEDKIKEKYKDNPEVLAELNRTITAIQKVHNNSLERAKEYRRLAEEERKAGGSRGLAGGQGGEEAAKVEPSTTAGEETEEEKGGDLLAQMSGEGPPDLELGGLGSGEAGETAPERGPVAVLKLSPDQIDVLDYGTTGEKKALRAQLLERRTETEKRMATAEERDEDTEPLRAEIAAIEELLNDERLQTGA
ncbi:MAG: hypothetical protein ACLFUZ_04365 [Candidatus Micrarchaeia archaeon]